MAAGVFAGVLAVAILFLFVSTSVQGGDHDGGGGPPGECYAHPREIYCLQINLELILRVAVEDYVSKHPEIKEQDPSFNAFKDVHIPPGSFTPLCLKMLSSNDIRESLIYCVDNYSKENKTYIPSSPVQMYKDLCAQDAEYRAEGV